MRKPCKFSSRRALSLLEIVAVMAVIAVLSILIFPAIQAARESARKSQCLSHLSQIGRALASYESVHGRFPAGIFSLSGQSSGGGPGTDGGLRAPHVWLLPFLEQQPLFERDDPYTTQGASEWDATSIMSVRLPIFLCPSDGVNRRFPGNNYRACIGSGITDVETLEIPEWGGGAFTESHRAADFLDGLSSTAAFSEKVQGNGNPGWYHRQRDLWSTGVSAIYESPFDWPSRDEMVGICTSIEDQPSNFMPYTGAVWYLSSIKLTLYNHVVTPNAPVPDCELGTGRRGRRERLEYSGYGISRASSFHPGGVNTLFMDGSARFVSDAIDRVAWRALGTRAGRESVVP